MSKETGEVIVESSAFVNDQVDEIICDELDDFCYDYNENPAEAIEKLKRGDYDPMEIL